MRKLALEDLLNDSLDPRGNGIADPARDDLARLLGGVEFPLVMLRVRLGCEVVGGRRHQALLRFGLQGQDRDAVVGFSRLDGAEQLEADAFRGEPVALATGIARPERVRESLDAEVVSFVKRRDHYPWKITELDAIAAGARAARARALLVTGKDAVKLDGATTDKLPIYRIDIETHILDGDALDALLNALPPLR